jgi:ribosomal subunit interface protein
MDKIMIFNISGHQVEIGESLQQYVKNKLESKVTKFFKDAISTHVTFGKEGAFLTAEILVNDGVTHQNILKSNGTGLDVYSAFEDANHKTDTQLRKYKELTKSHHKNHHQNPRKDDSEGF